MAFALHEVIGNYECLGIIRKPRAGLTYKVKNLVTGEVEALRALTRGASDDVESAERLSREIRIHTRLTHPNIVAFHDAFELDGHLVMTTDYVEGPTLAHLCGAGPLPTHEGVAIVLQVLEGLEEAHALGIVHRGVTAEQVIVPANGAVKLGGFDMAKPGSDNNLTRVGAVIGDPRYLAPEQIQGKAVLDGRADLYAVGVLLFLCLAGVLPFEGQSDIDVLSAHIGSAPPRPAAFNPAIPAALEDVVLKALQKNPDDRFSTAREFADALLWAAQAAVAASPNPSAEAAPARSTPRLLLVAIGLVVLVLAAWAAFH